MIQFWIFHALTAVSRHSSAPQTALRLNPTHSEIVDDDSIAVINRWVCVCVCWKMHCTDAVRRTRCAQSAKLTNDDAMGQKHYMPGSMNFLHRRIEHAICTTSPWLFHKDNCASRARTQQHNLLISHTKSVLVGRSMLCFHDACHKHKHTHTSVCGICSSVTEGYSGNYIYVQVHTL